ncbi:AGAP006552-PA-like protein [Anopheles sinensis]|uniref:AGAP006552-PA-like protein n=1 Tax=Anopheles sinensis TaxID=74873 RepID=A0A084WMP3_ANOSI|nr:AGAP006552-PA-like protein [Anopheles sinensis]
MKSIVAFAMFIGCVAMVQSGCVRTYPSYDYSGVLSYPEARPFCGLRNDVYPHGAPYVGPVYPYGRVPCGGCGSCSSCRGVHVPKCGGCGSCSHCRNAHVLY